MNSLPRNFFILLLVLLQFLGSEHDTSTVQADDLFHSHSGIIVDIGSGIKQQCGIQEISPDVLILTEAPPSTPTAVDRNGNFSAPDNPPGLPPLHLPNTPRAPPAA